MINSSNAPLGFSLALHIHYIFNDLQSMHGFISVINWTELSFTFLTKERCELFTPVINLQGALMDSWVAQLLGITCTFSPSVHAHEAICCVFRASRHSSLPAADIAVTYTHFPKTKLFLEDWDAAHIPHIDLFRSCLIHLDLWGLNLFVSTSYL